MADLTKKAIAEGLKELCRHKSFAKISVRDITEQCGLNRQTFYYHFQDKYELLDWIYYNEGFIKLVDSVTFENWHLHMRQLLETMRRDKTFYENTIACSPEGFEDYLFEITCTLFEEAIQRLDEGLRLDPQEILLYARFYSYGICGVVLAWVKKGMQEEPEALSAQIRKLASDSEKMASLRLTGNF